MKIYVASSWRNEYQPSIVAVLESMCHEVYDFRNPNEHNKGFAWSEIDPKWQGWSPDAYVKALNHPRAEEGFKFDFDAMKWADCCVMVLPCGRSANTEAGWMKGNGKQVFVFQPIPQEPELMYKIYDGIITSVAGLRQQFEGVEICEWTGKKYQGTHLVDCKCQCHEKGSEMVHMQACCDNNGKTEERRYIE